MYQSKSDLPETLREWLPEDLQEIYLKAYQKSWEGYDESDGGQEGQEAVAHRDGMMAVEHDHVYHEETGQWLRKGEKAQKKQEENLLHRVERMIKKL